MKDPASEIAAALKTQCDSALSTAGYSYICVADPTPKESVPFVRLDVLDVQPRHNKTVDGTDTYIQLSVIDRQYVRGLALKNVVMEGVTDRTSPITTASHDIISTELDYAPSVISEETPNGIEHSFPIRIHYRTSEK